MPAGCDGDMQMVAWWNGIVRVPLELTELQPLAFAARWWQELQHAAVVLGSCQRVAPQAG